MNDELTNFEAPSGVIDLQGEVFLHSAGYYEGPCNSNHSLAKV